MTGIERLRDVCRALKYSPYCGTDIATIGGEPAYEKLSKIADQIEREIKEAVTDGADDEDDALVYTSGTRTGIEMLRSYVHHARVYVRNLYINHVADINAVPLYEKLRVCLRQLDEIADRIERETLPRPRFEDGEPVQFGDEFVTELGDVGEVEQIDLREGGWSVWSYSSHKASNTDGPLKRPEPPDTWEQIAADVAKADACSYFGFAYDDGCDGCKANDSDMGCSWEMTNDVLRRAKKLAGVE